MENECDPTDGLQEKEPRPLLTTGPTPNSNIGHEGG